VKIKQIFETTHVKTKKPVKPRSSSQFQRSQEPIGRSQSWSNSLEISRFKTDPSIVSICLFSCEFPTCTSGSTSVAAADRNRSFSRNLHQRALAQKGPKKWKWNVKIGSQWLQWYLFCGMSHQYGNEKLPFLELQYETQHFWVFEMTWHLKKCWNLHIV